MKYKELLVSSLIFMFFWFVCVHIATTYVKIYDIATCWIMGYGYFVGLVFMAISESATEMIFIRDK